MNVEESLESYFNKYQDRGIVKWSGGFFLSEHTAEIEKEKAQEKAIERLPQQTPEVIEYYLDQSIKYNKLLDIQLNTLDQLDRVKPHVRGVFRGFLDMDTVMISDVCIDYADMRHISAVDFVKWSDMDKAADPFGDIEIAKEIDEFCDAYFNDGEFLE